MIEHMDGHGLIGFKRSDGRFDFGDSCQRTMSYHLLMEAHRRLHIKLEKYPHSDLFAWARAVDLFKAGGRYVRHPSPEWWSNPDNFSRDQATPLVITMALFGFKRRLAHFFRLHLKRCLLFMPNVRRNHQYKTRALQEDAIRRGVVDNDWDYGWKMPDPTGPGFWSIYIRGFKRWFLYPLLQVFDLDYLINSILIDKNPKQFDISNHLNSLILAHFINPTWASRNALLILDLDDIQIRLAQYYKLHPWGSDSTHFIKLYMSVLRAIKKAA